MTSGRDYVLLSALAVICVASIVHLLPRGEELAERECQCQCQCECLTSSTCTALVAPSPPSVPNLEQKTKEKKEKEEKAKEEKEKEKKAKEEARKPSPTSSPSRQPLFETLKNVRPGVTFTWPTPMPLLPPEEARAFLREGEGANWIPDHVRSELKLREKPVRAVSAIMIDCELDVLEIRLMELYDIIDVFVIAEANTTQTGAPKRLHFWENRYRYQQWWPKIKHLVLWEGYHTTVAEGDWYNEHLGPSKLKQSLNGLDDDDIIFGGDADEIPYRDTVMLFRHYTGYPERVRMIMRWTEMTYFWRIVSKGPWELRSIATYREAKHAKNLRDIATQWDIGTHPSVYSGWHCSWCFPHQDIRNKYRNVIEPKWREQGELSYTEDQYKEMRDKGLARHPGALMGLDMNYHPRAAMERFKYLSYLNHVAQCGWCRLPEGSVWPVESIGPDDPIPEDLIELSKRCSNDVTRSYTIVVPH